MSRKMVDPTHGRYLLPVRDYELILLSNPHLISKSYRAFFPPITANNTTDPTPVDTEEVKLAAEELEGLKVGGKQGKTDRWVFYRTLEMKPEGLKSEQGRGKSIVMVHGYVEFGGRYAHTCVPLLEAGFKVHLIDLPSHGRSTGVHCDIPEPLVLPNAIHTILYSAQQINPQPTPAPAILIGTSLGGMSVLLAGVKGVVKDVRGEKDVEGRDLSRGEIVGVFAMCPLIDVPKESKPGAATIAVGRALSSVAGKLPLSPQLSSITDDAELYKHFHDDPMMYSGKLRIATGLGFLRTYTELLKNAEKFDIPVRIVHGESDTQTSLAASEEFIRRASSTDKSLGRYPGYYHVMVKVIEGRVNDTDKEKNQVILDDMLGWVLKHA